MAITLNFKRVVIILLVLIITIVTIGIKFSDKSVDLCDQLAADPHDPYKLAQGVAFEEIQPVPAATACLKTLESNLDDPIIIFQLGRALFAGGELEEASTYLSHAAELGYPAAYSYMADLLLLQDEGEEELILFLYEQASEGGYAPAGESHLKLTRSNE